MHCPSLTSFRFYPPIGSTPFMVSYRFTLCLYKLYTNLQVTVNGRIRGALRTNRGAPCGLRWEDFDEVNGTLKIRRTVRRDVGKGLSTGDTKTYAGTRCIILPPTTAALLRERKKTALTEWIFPNPLKPEEPTSPDTAYNHLKVLLKKAGLPDIRFHDLRHTFATHALTSGVDIKTLSGILGHTRAAFTLDTYTHTTGDMQWSRS